jgi:glutathione S-transferase
MKIYGLPFSSFTMRVALAARIKGHDLPIETPPGGGLQSPEFQAASPSGRIPLLEEEDGWRLSESGAIVDYLDETLDGPPLYPATPRDRARAREMIAIAETELGPGLRHFALQCMFRAYDCPAKLAYGRDQVALALGALERVGLGDTRWAIGETPGAVDCALIPMMVFCDMFTTHFDAGPLLEAHPKAQAYWNGARADPLGAHAAEVMGRFVPIVMARRAAA